MPAHSISDATLTRTVEITKAALGAGTTSWINSADIVARFIETVAVKLEHSGKAVHNRNVNRLLKSLLP